MLAQQYEGKTTVHAITKRIAVEGWVALREAYWTRAETVLLERIQDEYLAERLAEMRAIRKAMPFVFEHLLPVMESDPEHPGEIRPKRDPATGMPVFSQPFRSYEGVTKSWLQLQERQMLLRGEATMRTESALADRTDTTAVDVHDPIAQMAARANFSPDEIRALAREMVTKRLRAQGQLSTTEDVVIEAEKEDDGDADEEV